MYGSLDRFAQLNECAGSSSSAARVGAPCHEARVRSAFCDVPKFFEGEQCAPVRRCCGCSAALFDKLTRYMGACGFIPLTTVAEGGGTTTTVTSNIPDWLQDPTKRMVARGEGADRPGCPVSGLATARAWRA